MLFSKRLSLFFLMSLRKLSILLLFLLHFLRSLQLSMLFSTCSFLFLAFFSQIWTSAFVVYPMHARILIKKDCHSTRVAVLSEQSPLSSFI